MIKQSSIYSKLRESSRAKSKTSLKTFEDEKSTKDKSISVKVVDLKCSPIKNKSNSFAGLNSMFEYKTPVRDKYNNNKDNRAIRFDCFGNKICKIEKKHKLVFNDAFKDCKLVEEVFIKVNNPIDNSIYNNENEENISVKSSKSIINIKKNPKQDNCSCLCILF